MFFRRFNFCIWRTKPVHLFDFLLWWLIKLVWEPFSLKRSHWWHWVIRPLPANAKPLVIQGDDHDKPRDRVASQTNFSWRKVALVTTNFYPYQVGWNQLDNPKFKANEFEMCTIVRRGVVGLLVGPGVTNFYAQTLDGQPLELKLLDYATKVEAINRGYQTY